MNKISYTNIIKNTNKINKKNILFISNKKILHELIIHSSYKRTIIYLYNYDFKLIKQWSIKSKKYNKLERRKNTKYNLYKLTRDIKYFCFIQKIFYINLTFIGTGLARRYFLDFLLYRPNNITIIKILDKTPLPFNGCRPKKKKRK